MAPRKTRSAITSGRRQHLGPADGRSAPARRRNDIVAELLSSIPTPTDMERGLAERAAALRVSLEIQDSYMLAGDERFKPALHARVSGAYLRTLQALHSNDVHAPRKRADVPTTLEQLFDLRADPAPARHTNRFAKAVLDQDDETQRVFNGNDDAPGIARNAARDRKLAKLYPQPKSNIKRRFIRKSKR